MFANRKLTEDGLECTFALNHMAYFVITQGLRERLLASAPARIVSTASAAHQADFDDLQLAKSFGPMKAYGRSKLCNILFTRELARRLHSMGVTANCLHPGFVATRFGDQSGGVISRFVGLAKLFAISPEKGAGNNHLSCVFAQDRRDDGPIFLQVPPNCAFARSTERQNRKLAVGAQRRIGGPEGPLNLRAERLHVLVDHDPSGLHNFLDLFKQFAKISIRCRARSSMNVHRVDPARMH